jgi:hypothetical protein
MSTRTRTWEAAVVAFVLLVSSASVCLHAEEWAPLEGADTLRDLVAGATAEIEMKPGHVAVGQYRADGTATVTAWGETYERTWEVVGDDRVCYSSLAETNCYTFETNVDAPGEFRARHVETGEIRVFRVTQDDPEEITADTAPGGEGGLGAPSASEVAAALSNPNTSMGTMNTLFDFVAYDGDLQDAGSQRAFRATFQPSLPYPVSPATNLFVRPLVPVIFSQDVPTADRDAADRDRRRPRPRPVAAGARGAGGQGLQVGCARSAGDPPVGRRRR